MNFGFFLANQYARGDDLRARLAGHVGQVRLAREAGFDSVWTGQHYLSAPFSMVQPIPLLARIAAEAEGMRLGTAVLLLPLHHPLEVAETAATMDLLTGGRFVLGVGLGYRDEEFRAFGVPRHDAPRRMVEGLETIRALWAGGTLSHPPLQRPGPPIWMAGLTAGAVRRAARFGDAWIGSPKASLPVLEERAALYRSEAAAAGRAVSELAVIREIYVGADPEAARRQPRMALEKMYGGYAAWDRGNRVAPDDPLAVPYESLMQDRFIVGDPDECVEQLLPYRDRLGATLLMLRFQWPGLDDRLVIESMTRFASRVKPAFEKPSRSA